MSTTTRRPLLSTAQDAVRAFLREHGAEVAEYSTLPVRLPVTGAHRVAVIAPDGSPVDTLATDSAARHAAHLLNIGAATVYPHAPTGCRVQPLPVASPALTGRAI